MATVRIDRIEGETAVLEHDARPFEIPARLLPEGAREGDVLDWTLRIDPNATRQAREAQAVRRSRLARDDDGGDFSL